MIEQVKGTRNLFGAESEKYIHIFNAFVMLLLIMGMNC